MPLTFEEMSLEALNKRIFDTKKFIKVFFIGFLVFWLLGRIYFNAVYNIMPTLFMSFMIILSVIFCQFITIYFLNICTQMRIISIIKTKDKK